jgi:alcohol dehydrogenase
VDRTARALVLEGPRDLRPRDLALPEPSDDNGVLRIEACGLCGTDHEQFTGRLFPGYPFVPGHEIVGVIEQIGARAATRLDVAVGDRVAVEIFRACRACEHCRAREFRHCREHGLRDSYGFVGVDEPPGLWGGYATHLHLDADALVLPIPDGIDAALATVFNPLGAGVRWAHRLPGTSPGDVVAVLGPGIRGLCAAVAAKEAGAAFVMVTGRGERDAPRLALAPRFGADLTVDVEHDDPHRALRAAVGRGADVVVDVTANAPTAAGQAIRLARREGTVVLAGMTGFRPAEELLTDELVTKELRVIGVLGVDTDDYATALELLASDRYPFAELPRAVAGFDDLPHLLTTMAGEGDTPPVHGVFAPSAGDGR